MNSQMIKEINRLFAEYDRGRKPGYAVSILRSGRTVFSKGYGLASLEHGAPITPKTIFDVGSTSKQFVGMCISILEMRKKLSLEDDVRKFFPEMRHRELPVRIRHLLCHTSGVRDYLALMELAGLRYENEYPDEQILGMITRQRALNFNPGEEFLYSNSGYLLLGEIVRRVSGETLGEFAKRNIFEPLGMRSTYFHDDFTRVVPGKATGYSVAEGTCSLSMSLFDVVGDGGVCTNLEDLARWDANFYANRLHGGRDLLRKMTEPGTLNDGRRLEYARGLFLSEYRGLKVVSHGGAWMGYRAEVMRFPEVRTTIVCLSNFAQAKPTFLARRIADICLCGELSGNPSPAAPVSAGKLHSIAGVKPKSGVYFAKRKNDFVEIWERDGKSVFRDDEWHYELYPLGGGRYGVASGSRELEAGKDKDGRLWVILKKLNAAPARYFYAGARKKMAACTAAELEGAYRSEELDVEYRLFRKKAKLYLERPGAQAEELGAIREGLLAGEFLSLEMSGKRKFLLNAGRVRGLRFVKVR